MSAETNGRSKLATFLHALSRKKDVPESDHTTQLHRCLNVWELTLMGIGGMVGSGIYFLVGQAAKQEAGPGIVLSFALAGVVVALAALCLMEFAARVPRTGSVYVYMYMSLGEFMAFLSGWCALMGVISGCATNGRAWSAYLDVLFGNTISNFTMNHITHWTVGKPIAEYPDFVAAGVILVMTIIVASGANCSAKFNGVFAGFNVCILLFCSVVGFVYGDIKNWTNTDNGGYLPFGWSGIIRGASTCFWALTGFEIVATTVEEAKNPKRNIPLATGSSIGLVTILYMLTAAALTYVTPYTNLDLKAPLPSAFEAKHLKWVYYIVSIGPLFGLTTTLFSGLYSFVRITYAMALDGLLFPCFTSVNKCTKVPVWTTVSGGFIMATIACFFDIDSIITFGIIVALTNYALVDICVIILRYRPNKEGMFNSIKLPSDEDLNTGTVTSSAFQWRIKKFRETADVPNGLSDSMNNLWDDSTGEMSDDHSNRGSVTSDNLDHLESVSQTSVDLNEVHTIHEKAGTLKPAFYCLKKCLSIFPNKPGECVMLSIFFMILCMVLLSFLLVFGEDHLEHFSWWTLLILLTLSLSITVLLFIVYAHKQSLAILTLKVPCLPWLPATSFFLCVLLMVCSASLVDWLVFTVILVIGMVVYFSYGIRHSALNTSSAHVQHISGDTRALLDDISDDEL